MKKSAFRRVLSLATTAALTLGMSLSIQAAEAGLTRGEMAELLVANAGLTSQVAAYAAQPSAFKDVAEDSKYEGVINLAYAKGMIAGTGDNKFSPDAKATLVEAATVAMKSVVPAALMTEWPADYNEMAVWSGVADGLDYVGSRVATEAEFAAMLTNSKAVAAKPIIGISWAYNDQADEYAYYKTVIKEAGGLPVELPQITSSAVSYDAEGMIEKSYLEESGTLKQD